MGISEATGHSTAEIELKGKKYIISALTIRDYGAIEDDMKRDKKIEIREIIEEFKLKGAEAAKFMAEELKGITWVDSLSSPKGVCQIAYHSIHKLDKNFTLAQAENLIDMGNMKDFMEKLRELGESGGTEKNQKGQAEAKETN